MKTHALVIVTKKKKNALAKKIPANVTKTANVKKALNTRFFTNATTTAIAKKNVTAKNNYIIVKILDKDTPPGCLFYYNRD